jgi:hypothetical protein
MPPDGRYWFSDLPRPVQVQLAGIGPLLFGGVVGFILSESSAGYWILTGLSVVGGIAGGLEHRTLRGAAIRGVVAGTLFATGIVVAHAISEERKLTSAPSPIGLLIPLAAIGGALLASLGWRLARGRT